MRARWSLALLVLLLLSATPAAACSFIVYDTVRCADAAGVLQSHNQIREGSSGMPAPADVNVLCPGADPELAALYARQRHAPPFSRPFVIEPSTPEREAELVAEREAYLSCDYPDFERAGDWLVSSRRERSYCAEALDSSRASCPGPLAISPVRFLVFLVANPSLRTLPYLLPYLLVVVTLAAFAHYLWRCGELRAFLRPTRGIQIAFILSLLTLPLWLPALGVRWSSLDVLVLGLLFDYPLICLARYLWRRRQGVAG